MLILFLLLFLGGVVANVKGEATKLLPDLIRPCYGNNYQDAANPPLSMALLIELIRKIELGPTNPTSMRLLSSALFHGVLYDGIRKQRIANMNYIQYSAVGPEFNKYKLISDNFVENRNFPNGSLSQEEICFLHKLVSNTIDPEDAMNSPCPVQRPMPLEMDEPDNNPMYCQPKRGTVTTNWGSVAASNLLMGITYGLEQSDVTFEGVNRNFKAGHRMRLQNDSTVTIFVATIASDLAGAVLNLRMDPVMGKEGIWNDTYLPRAFYFKSNDTAVTEDEILGSIDATIIGLNIKSWELKGVTMRLSQVLDMFYSNRGISFNPEMRASNREDLYEHLMDGVDLADQVANTFSLLVNMGADLNGSPTPEEVRTLAESAVSAHSAKAQAALKKHGSVESMAIQNNNAPLEILIVLDSTYDSYTSERLLNFLVESLQMSYYGTRIGVINGETGNWISNVTTEIYDLYRGLYQNRDSWPVTLNLEPSLKTVSAYLQNRTNIDCSHPERPLARAVVIFSKSGRATDREKSLAETSLRTIKDTFPETNMLYVSDDENGFFATLSQKFSNDSVLKPGAAPKEPEPLARQMVERLARIPAGLVFFYCDNNKFRFEDYITPDAASRYEIHEEYIRRTHFSTKIKNFDYGDIEVCLEGMAAASDCRVLQSNADWTYKTSDYCSEDEACNVKFRVSANKTSSKCAENACRYPDQIRIEFTYAHTSGTAAAWAHPALFLPIALVLAALAAQ